MHRLPVIDSADPNRLGVFARLDSVLLVVMWGVGVN